MKTKYLGPLEGITVWHDNLGRSPDWLLSKIVIVDALKQEKYVTVLIYVICVIYDLKYINDLFRFEIALIQL